MSNIFLSFHRGRIKLKSDNPYDHPVIIPNYYQDPQDIKPILEALKAGKAIGAALKKYNTTFYDNTLSTCEKYDKGKKFITCYGRFYGAIYILL